MTSRYSFENKFSELTFIDDEISVIYHTNNATYNDNLREVNVLRHSILTQIKTYAIEYVVVHSEPDTIPIPDELLAHRLGLIPINNEHLSQNQLKFRVDSKDKAYNEPYYFSTDDIPEIPFVGTTPIVQIPAGGRLIFDVILKEGNRSEHVKFGPVVHFVFNKIEGGFMLKMKSLGMLSPNRILKEGYEGMAETEKQESKNMYFTLQTPS